MVSNSLESENVPVFEARMSNMKAELVKSNHKIEEQPEIKSRNNCTEERLSFKIKETLIDESYFMHREQQVQTNKNRGKKSVFTNEQLKKGIPNFKKEIEKKRNQMIQTPQPSMDQACGTSNLESLGKVVEGEIEKKISTIK